MFDVADTASADHVLSSPCGGLLTLQVHRLGEVQALTADEVAHELGVAFEV
jgi:hypothetical protein